jgi:DNA-directed RNA polymerase subunit RPC12/RpoP
MSTPIRCEHCGGERFQEHGRVSYAMPVDLTHDGNSIVRVDDDVTHDARVCDDWIPEGIECASCCTSIVVKESAAA